MRSLLNSSRWISLFITVAAGIGAAFLFHYYLSDWQQSIADSLISTLIFVLCVWSGIVAVNRYPTRSGIIVYALFIGIVAGTIAWYTDKLLLRWWFSGDTIFLSWLDGSNIARLVFAIILSCWIITLAALKKGTKALEDQLRNISDASTLHREAELFKLRQQLQPHFLYNSLNSISALIMIQPDSAQEMIGKLSDFLRNSVKREAREQIPVEEELEYIEAYLAIEAVRFGDRLKVNYKKEYTDSATIPPFLLQPLLENAIKFGLYGQTGAVTIDMYIKLEADFLIISISNPFDASNRPASGTGFGLKGVQRRLYLLYARTDLLETKHENNFFTTLLKIPQGNV